MQSDSLNGSSIFLKLMVLFLYCYGIESKLKMQLRPFMGLAQMGLAQMGRCIWINLWTTPYVFLFQTSERTFLRCRSFSRK